MRLYWQILKLLFRKLILRKRNGTLVKEFAKAMGIVYIKLAQILATQNYGQLFTEDDRRILSDICDNCNPMPFHKIKSILEQEYDTPIDDIFSYIAQEPVGSASVSQVHYARLKTGEEVAIKVKRQDISRAIERDIARLQKLMRRFGWLIKLQNYAGGSHALDLYLQWIHQEVDFRHEIENIKLFSIFHKKSTIKSSELSRFASPHCMKITVPITL